MLLQKLIAYFFHEAVWDKECVMPDILNLFTRWR